MVKGFYYGEKEGDAGAMHHFFFGKAWKFKEVFVSLKTRYMYFDLIEVVRR